MTLGLLVALFCIAETAWAGTHPVEHSPSEFVEDVFEDGLTPRSSGTRQVTTQAASGDQHAIAGALASQQTPTNTSVVVRILSPGDDAAEAQVIGNRADAASANGSAIDQEAAMSGLQSEHSPEFEGDLEYPDGDQYQAGDITQNQVENPDLARVQASEIDQSSTQNQASDSDAVARQFAPTNIYISVRVLSPGDSGPVIQVIDNSAVSEASNAADTQQLAEAQQPSGPDAVAVADHAPDPTAPADPGQEDVDRADGLSTDALATKDPAQEPPVTNEQANVPGVDADADESQTATRGDEQYYGGEDQYHESISDLGLGLGLELVLNPRLEPQLDMDQILDSIQSWNWESLAAQLPDTMPGSDIEVPLSHVDAVVGELVGDAGFPVDVPEAVTVPEIGIEAPSSRSEFPQSRVDGARIAESARVEPLREQSVVVTVTAGEASAAPAESEETAPGWVRQPDPGRSSEPSIVLLGADSGTVEFSSALSKLPRLHFPQTPGDLLSHSGNTGTGGSPPPAILPAGTFALGTAGLLFLLHLTFSVWRARGLVLPLERPG